MAFNTNVSDMVALVVDETHPRYGEIARILYHDWREYGEISVEFPNGDTEEFYDGLMKGDDPSKIKRFYRHADKEGIEYDSEGIGPASFQREFLNCDGTLEKLAQDYRILFDEDLPEVLGDFNK